MQNYCYHDPNKFGPSKTNYPAYNNPQYNNTIYNNPRYNRPQTPTNLLAQFNQFAPAIEFDFGNTSGFDVEYSRPSLSRLSLNSNDNQFLDVGWSTREHDVSLTLAHKCQM